MQIASKWSLLGEGRVPHQWGDGGPKDWLHVHLQRTRDTEIAKSIFEPEKNLPELEQTPCALWRENISAFSILEDVVC